MIEHSESIGKIMAAVLAVQQAVDHVEKNSKNPHFGSTYTDLNTFLKALREPMAEHGIVMLQGPGIDGENVTLDTMLYHSSGEWLRNRAGAPMQKADPQGAGSGITYLRRYSLAALFAIPQEDDDGNAASTPPRKSAKGSPKNVDSYTGEIDGPTCPRCSGEIWDNRAKKADGKFSAKSPDYTCRDKDGCGWALWLNSAQDELRQRLTVLKAKGAITEDAVENCMAGVTDGSLDSLRIAEDWIKSKEADE